MTRAHVTSALALAMSLAVIPQEGAAAEREEAGSPVVVAPTGVYAMAVLEFDIPAPWSYVGSLRDGRMLVDHGIGITQPGGTLELANGILSGTFQRPPGELVSKGTPPVATIRIDATVADGAIAGTCTVDGTAGTVKGRLLSEAQLANGNAVPHEKSWPSFLGPAGGGVCAEPTGSALVESLDKASMVWRSEERIGNDMGSITRFMATWDAASTIRTSGQGSSPVLADGRVFMCQRIPAGTQFDLKAHHGSSSMDMAAVRAAGFQDIPWFAKEKLLARADELVIAMDAATGKTLWKATFPLRAPNVQYHKDRGGDRTPVVVGDTVVAIAYEGGLMALEAASGRLRWEAPSGTGHNTPLVAAGDVVVAPAKTGSWAGYDIATGKTLWQQVGTATTATLATWRHGDARFVLIPTVKPVGKERGPITLSCVAARTGATAWSMPLPLEATVCGITVSGDVMVVFEHADASAASDPAASVPEQKAKAARIAAGSDGDAGDPEGGGVPGQVSAYELSDTGARKRWTVPLFVHPDCQPLVLRGKQVVAMAGGRSVYPHKVIDLMSGKVLSTLVGPGPANGGYVQAMEDRIFVRHDGTHGRIAMSMYEVDEQGLMRLMSPEPWAPPIGGSTTSYHHPIMYPMVDGRIYLRQVDGIYCWDLRKPVP